MPDPVDALILDLLESLSNRSKPYREVIEAWRTSCPRLPVWEEANARGYIVQLRDVGNQAQVSLSKIGAAHLQSYRPGSRTSNASETNALNSPLK